MVRFWVKASKDMVMVTGRGVASRDQGGDSIRHKRLCGDAIASWPSRATVVTMPDVADGADALYVAWIVG